MAEGNAPTLAIDAYNLKKAALHFRAVNHALRQQILHLLHQNGRMDVTSIYQNLKLDQSIASQHLAVLRKANMVQSVREKKNVFYTVNYHHLNRLNSVAKELLDK